ncbi:histidine kinase [Streptomyces spiroverticillatus]|uniref:histidine kinase n=1 Tax=Streptomyces finlayi TaxID=67296 RepID=A0A918X7T2_9ACTN|nr:nitrate- and nitrite sensing domain-containing protein [Streptomyces finlayi]GHA41858.1 histidine kinase [Streptomyces spiroverticillatus]GHD17370.1 histidine kinase [Streptomyces finlayi]
MRFRGKSIRRKIVALLLVPLVSLTALWGFATVLTGREASELLDVSYVVEKIGSPVEDAVQVLQAERRQTLVYLADERGSEALTDLTAKRTATDTALANLRRSAKDPDVVGELNQQSAGRLTSVLAAFDTLPTLRRQVQNSTITRKEALNRFNMLVDPCHTFLANLHVVRDVEMDKQGRALVGATRARELVSREDALVASALAAGQITADEIRTLTGLIAGRDILYNTSLEQLPAFEREAYDTLWNGPDTAPLRGAEKELLEQGATKRPTAVSAQTWNDSAPPVLISLARRGTEASDNYQDRVEPVAFNVLLKAGAAGVLGFLALVVSVVVSVRIGRSLVRDLNRLRKEAHEASGVRLPAVMRRLAAGETVDVETEAPRLSYEKDEMGQVGQALNTLQRAAVESAVRQAEMRRGVSEVFVNLARRNQVLLHRQLTLLDTMERRTEDTDELADLFRLDHLTTRMRRHAEGLVILSGAAPSRQWRKPVQLMDVVRAAVAEVEDYERIEVRRLPRIGVGGPAVADLTHLIAELLENATVFSPPHTAVQVLGERVANGFTLEIHDRGLGMAADLLLDANLRLAETPEFELSDTDRLGLFVVSRLAQRQNVRVSLQQSPYGGTTAVVFIPATLLTEAPDTDGAGFSVEHAPDRGRADEPTGSGRRQNLTAVGRTPVPRPVLDGPVELEAPLGTLGLEPAPALGTTSHGGLLGDLEDTESERGGIFRARGLDKPRKGQERPRGRSAADLPKGGRKGAPRPRIADAARVQHQQAADPAQDGTDTVRPDAPVPLPRRKPSLVAEHGRRIGPRTEQPAAPTDIRQPAAPTDTEETPAAGALPRRVRQASLAPQLKKEGEASRTAETPRPSADPEPERDAEEVRSRMASLQRGWQRGRRQNEADAGQDRAVPTTDTPPAERARTAPGTPQADQAETAPGTTAEGDGR